MGIFLFFLPPPPFFFSSSPFKGTTSIWIEYCTPCLFVFAFVCSRELLYDHFCAGTSQWGAADAEIKVPSRENTKLKRSPFKAWSRSVYSHTCYAYCQGFLSCLLICTLPVHSSAFFSKTSPDFFLCWLWLTHGSCVGPQNNIRQSVIFWGKAFFSQGV